MKKPPTTLLTLPAGTIQLVSSNSKGTPVADSEDVDRVFASFIHAIVVPSIVKKVKEEYLLENLPSIDPKN